MIEDILIERVKRALEMAAAQADHWPVSHADDWGRDLDGNWTNDVDKVSEYG